MPVYHQDLEEREGLPEKAQELKRLMKAHDGFLISSPEHNSAISALLKNTIDWVSRSGGTEEEPLIAFKNKVAVLMSASPGGLGGLRGLVSVRSILMNMGVLVLPNQKEPFPRRITLLMTAGG